MLEVPRAPARPVRLKNLLTAPRAPAPAGPRPNVARLLKQAGEAYDIRPEPVTSCSQQQLGLGGYTALYKREAGVVSGCLTPKRSSNSAEAEAWPVPRDLDKPAAARTREKLQHAICCCCFGSRLAP